MGLLRYVFNVLMLLLLLPYYSFNIETLVEIRAHSVCFLFCFFYFISFLPKS